MDHSAFVGKLLEEQDGDTLREGIRVLAQRRPSCSVRRGPDRAGAVPRAGRARRGGGPQLQAEPSGVRVDVRASITESQTHTRSRSRSRVSARLGRSTV